MRVFNFSPIRWITVVFAILILLPLVVAALVPVLAPIPAASAGWSAAPLPDRDEPLLGFQDLIEQLPIVVTDLPDAQSAAVVEAYQNASLTDMDSLVAFIQAAYIAVPVPPEFQEDWLNWFRALINDPATAPAPPEVVLDALLGDPENADRLVNFAIALFFYGSIVVEDVPRYDVNPWESTKRQAFSLMESVVLRYPDNRSAILSFNYWASLMQGVSGDLANGSMGKSALQNLVTNDPDDFTALHLLTRVTIKSSGAPDDSFLEEHLNDLTGSSDPRVAALAFTLLGDIELASASNSQSQSPFSANASARVALAHYDQALVFSDDVAIYSARCSALNILGDWYGAVVTLERAVELEPNSINLRTRLAQFQSRGHWHGESIEDASTKSRNTSRSALELKAADGKVPLTEFQLIPYSYAGPSSIHIGLHRTHLPFMVFQSGAGGRGGGMIVQFDLIPKNMDAQLDLENGVGTYPFLLSIEASIMLGDVEGIEADYQRIESEMLKPDWLWNETRWPISGRDSYISAARLVGDPENPSRTDLQNSWGRASSSLRFAGNPAGALAVCQSAVEQNIDTESDYSTADLWMCIGENAFLVGEFDEAIEAFREVDSVLYVGFVMEFTGDLDGAEEWYRNALDQRTEYFLEAGGVELRLADILQEKGDAAGAAHYYDLATKDLDGFLNPLLVQYAVSNSGTALLRMAEGSDGVPDCSGENASTCKLAAERFDAALKGDPLNPVYLMNRAWVARLMGDQELANELMLLAVESDHTLYPVLNDLGVANATTDPDAAHQYFSDAVAANPDYALGWWNLGVLEMQKGPSGILRGQAYLARAFARDKSLVTEPLKFKTDESIYRVEITDDSNTGANWTFGTASSLAATTFGLFGFVLVIIGTTKEVFKDKFISTFMDRTETTRSWAKRNLLPTYDRFRSQPWSTSVLFIATIVVMLLATALPAWRGDRDAAFSAAILAIFALVAAVATHEFGHRLSAHLMKAELEPVQWTPGIGVSLLLLPINLSSGPFPAQSVKTKDDTDRLWIYLFGPLANLLVFFAILVIYLLQPVPALRMIAIAQLAVMSYSVLPFEPLDGHPLQDAQPKLVAGISFLALFFGILFALGRL